MKNNASIADKAERIKFGRLDWMTDWVLSTRWVMTKWVVSTAHTTDI